MNRYERLENYIINKFNDFNTRLINKSIEEKIRIFKEMYCFIKQLSLSLGPFYVNYRIYELIRKNIIELENKYLNEIFITNIIPNYNFIQSKNLLSYQDNEYICHYIILKTRYFLHKEKASYNGSFANLDLTNYCLKAINYIMKICHEKGIKATKIKINPGFSEKAKLYNGGKFHYFAVIELNNKNYLLDPTYSQLFLLKRSIIDRIGIINLSGCDAGIFMYMDDERKLVADKILQDGFIKLNEDTLKHYLDGFAISYRNGLYYENTSDYSYTTNYTSKDYENFLKGLDSQINHEKISYLGYQRKPSKIEKR